MRSCKREANALLSRVIQDRADGRKRSEGGFILTLELLLLLSIFGIVIYFGLQLYQQHVISSVDPMGGPQVVIYDGNTNLVARAEAYNSNEGPQFIYRATNNGDLTLPNARTDPKDAALLGARSDGFTTRPRVYFLNANCTGPAYLLDPSADYEPALSAALNAAGAGDPIVSDMYSMQGFLYAIGPADGTHPAGTLYRALGRDTSNPHAPPAGAPPGAPPVSEFASLRYGAQRCRALPGPEATALQTYLVPITQALAPGFTPNGGSFITWVPPLWLPTYVNTTSPPIVSQTGSVIGIAPTPEGKATLPGKVGTGGEGNHPLP